MKLTSQMRSSACLIPTALAGEHLAEIDLLPIEADAAAGGALGWSQILGTRQCRYSQMEITIEFRALQPTSSTQRGTRGD